MYWVNSIGSYLWGERVKTLGDYDQKIQLEGRMSNIHRCPGEDIFNKGKLSYLSFTFHFNLTLSYII